MIRRLGHVNLSVDDIEAARRFYRDLLDLPPIAKPPGAGRRNGCWFLVGDVELHISEEVADNASSLRHIAFEVDDLAAARQRLAAGGCEIDDSRAGTEVRRFFVRDPAGNRIEIYSLA